MTEFRWFRATRQLWKVRGAVGAGFVTIAALGGSLAVSEALWLPSVAIGYVAFATTFLLVINTKCRVCDEWVLIHAFHHSKEWLIAVRGMDRCPNCGARDDDSPLI